MRRRTTPYTRDPSSLPYRVGTRSIYLLSGDGHGYTPLVHRLLTELERQGVEELTQRQQEAYVIVPALYLFALWDDPEVEWRATYDPDEVLLVTGAPLLEVGRVLRAELLGRGARTLGIDPERAIAILSRAVWGLGEEKDGEKGE